jgi:hypothetical protein
MVSYGCWLEGKDGKIPSDCVLGIEEVIDEDGAVVFTEAAAFGFGFGDALLGSGDRLGLKRRSVNS